MKKTFRVLTAIFLFITVLLGCSESKAVDSSSSETYHPKACEVYFSPDGGCTKAIVKELDLAKLSVLVQSYSFTSRPIAKALAKALDRGVRVEVIADPELQKEKRSQFDYIRQSGIPLFMDTMHNIAHNKIMVIDGVTVITGSFNFTTAAEKYNAENLLIIHDKDMAELYTGNWQAHRKHSELVR